jgi:hypothetical protein
MKRDFTYIDDVVEGVFRVMLRPANPDPKWSGDHPDPATSRAPYRIDNIGNHEPVELTEFIAKLEELIGRKAVTRMLDMQPGDVVASATRCRIFTVDAFPRWLRRFVEWYREHYRSWQTLHWVYDLPTYRLIQDSASARRCCDSSTCSSSRIRLCSSAPNMTRGSATIMSRAP